MPTHPHVHQVLDEMTGELDSHLQGAAATRALRGVVERQHGVVAHRQLSDVGLGEGVIQSRLDNGSLLPVHHGVFALGHRLLSRRATWMAAVIACGPGAVLSHGSAAELWDIRRTRRSGGSPRKGILLHQTRVLEVAEITEKDGIPVTSMERVLLDISARLDDRQTERALVAADRTKALRWEELYRLIDRTPRRPGASRLRCVALAVDPNVADTVSPLEIDFLALCRLDGLPMPQVNVLAGDYLVDFLWPRERVVVETDGYTYHADRSAFERDHARTVMLEASGYVVHRATYRMLVDEPGPFLQLVRDSLRRPSDLCESSSPAISSRT
jgi:very-short-patch-repair endonuclease